MFEQLALQFNFWPNKVAVTADSSPAEMAIYMLIDWNPTGAGMKAFALVALMDYEDDEVVRATLFPGDW